MMTACRAWLPADAAAPSLVKAALAEMIDAWSRAWFAGEPFHALGSLIRVPAPARRPEDMTWQACSAGLSVGRSNAAVRLLGASALGVPQARARTLADTQLLERVGTECVEDLKRRAAGLLVGELRPTWVADTAAAEEAASAVYRVEIGNPLVTLGLMLELSAGLFAAFVKARLPSPPRPAPLDAAEPALAQLPVRLSAQVGSCQLTVAELASLETGDVLVLDRELDAGLPLALEDRRMARGLCTIAQRDGALALTIAQPPGGYIQ